MAQGAVEQIYTTDGQGRNGPWTKYDVVIGGRKYTTFDKKLGSKAMGLVGQFVDFAYKETQNGQYTNTNITAISPIDGTQSATAQSSSEQCASASKPP